MGRYSTSWKRNLGPLVLDFLERNNDDMMTTSKEYLKFKQNNNKLSKNLKKQKHNFKPTYYQVIKDNIKNNKQSNKHYDELIKYFKSRQI